MVRTCQKKLHLIVAMAVQSHEKKFCCDLIFVWVTFFVVFCLMFYIFLKVLWRILFKFLYYYYYYYYYYCYYYYYYYYYYYFIIINLFFVIYFLKEWNKTKKVSEEIMEVNSRLSATIDLYGSIFLLFAIENQERFFYLFTYLFIYIFIYLFNYLFIYLFIYLFMHLFIYLYCILWFLFLCFWRSKLSDFEQLFYQWAKKNHYVLN